MADNDLQPTTVNFRVSALVALLAGSFSLGASTIGAIQSWLNSQTAVAVRVQHGGELDKMRDRIGRLETDIIRRTAERWTRSDHSIYEAEQKRYNDAQDREIRSLSNAIEKHQH